MISARPDALAVGSRNPRSPWRNTRGILFFSLIVALAQISPSRAFARDATSAPCSKPTDSRFIASPKELRSRNGRLQVTFSLRNSIDSTGQMQYCYVDGGGDRSPTLRLLPGDLLVLTLKNELSLSSAAQHRHELAQSGCTSGSMAPGGTNLHFHGLSIPPTCHADDSLLTSIPPSKAFVYRFRIPRSQPPGLYWYHPHAHGHSEEQVLGGASGALIVEGLASANPLTAGLPERVFVLRDQKLIPSTQHPLDRDPSRPARDLSINFIPVPYPEYPVATISTKPGQRELWRVLNASADTYVNLAVLLNGEWKESGLSATHGSWQPLGLVAVDGVPISYANSAAAKVLWKTEILVPPGGRAEFIFQTPPEGTKAELFTGGAETNPPVDEDSPSTASGSSIPDTDDFTPPRPLARIVSSEAAVETPAEVETLSPANQARIEPVATIPPLRQRKLYFFEKIMDPKHPDTSTVFYITEEGHNPKPFDPSVLTPDIVVQQGDVEDWTIENRSTESHAFHIHQLHFLLLERDGAPASESYLLDTVDVPYWDGVSTQFPSVKLRMDFRDPEIVGTFPYHCHILQHADGGMMGLIQVRPKPWKVTHEKSAAKQPDTASSRAK